MAIVPSSFTRRPGVASDLFDDDFFNFGLPTLPGLPARSAQIPAANVWEEDDKYHIELAAPGLNKDDLDVTVSNGVLTISAEKKEEDKEEQDQYTRREFSYRSFSRSFTLPENTREDDISAKYEDGILKVEVKKKEKEETKSQKKIDIS